MHNLQNQNFVTPKGYSNRYNLSQDVVCLNKSKINTISFGGIDEWKKLATRNPAIKSLVQLQGFAVATGAFAGFVPSRHICSGFTIGMINAINDKFCENYSDYGAKGKLNKAMYAIPSLVAGIDYLCDKLSTANSRALITTATVTAATGGNILIGAVAGLVSKLSAEERNRIATNVGIVEGYGAGVITYLEYRKRNGGDSSSGSEGSGDLMKLPEVKRLNSPEDVLNYFRNLDENTFNKFIELHNAMNKFYIPRHLDIDDTYRLTDNKSGVFDKKIVIKVYDRVNDKVLLDKKYKKDFGTSEWVEEKQTLQNTYKGGYLCN